MDNKSVDPMLSVAEVAAQLGLSAKTVYRLKDKPNGIPAYKVGGRIRFKREEVDKFVASQVVKTAESRPGFSTGRITYKPGMRVVSI